MRGGDGQDRRPRSSRRLFFSALLLLLLFGICLAAYMLKFRTVEFFYVLF